MTVEATNSRVSYEGNGVSDTFVVQFKFLEPSDLVVVLHDTATGAETQLTLDSDYSVTGAGSDSGGAVTLVTPPPVGTKVIVYRDPPITQTTDWLENDPDPAEVKERAFDKLTMIAQRLDDRINRTVRLSDGDVAADLTLPAKEVRASKYLGFDANGEPMAVDGAGDATPISDFMKTVVDDSDAETARDTLGVFTGAFTAAGGSTAASLEDRFGDMLNGRRDFGLNPDGVTDNRAAFVAAFAACEGKTLFLPKGRYRVDMSNQGFLVPPANFTLVGDGPETIIEFYAKGTTGTKSLFRLQTSNVTFRNLTIEGDLDTGVTGLCFVPTAGHSGVLLEDVRIFGGVQEVAGAGNWIFDVFSLSGDCTDITVVRNHWDSVNWGFLKTNTATSTQRRIKLLDTLCTNMFSRPALFNTPSGIVDDVLVQGCTFKDSRMQDIGVAAHVAGGASVTNMRIIGCHFTGPNGEEILHFEEKCRGIVIADNTFDVDSGAVRILDNNVGGTEETPAFYTITGNVFRNTGTRGYRGVELVHDGDGTHPIEKAIISNNVFENYDVGLKMADVNNEVRVEGNVFKNCNTGIQPTAPTPAVQNNSFLDCTTGIQLTNGGLVGPQFFKGVTAPTTPITAINGEGALAGWSIDRNTFDVGTGNQDILMIPAGTEFDGRLSLSWFDDGGVYQMAAFDLNYDGATLTGGAAPLVQRSIGGVSLVGVAVVSGNLVLQLNNLTGSTRTATRLQAKFDGIHFFD